MQIYFGQNFSIFNLFTSRTKLTVIKLCPPLLKSNYIIRSSNLEHLFLEQKFNKLINKLLKIMCNLNHTRLNSNFCNSKSIILI